ncbi:MAG: radical SAM protein [Candidatus Omnitrophica bacterium]|nr:radical SAM protein [Candidatus Omnitrophota bacterium]MBU4333890.1 radical SAM protein [Candidatus Omnitrophota bacterium]
MKPIKIFLADLTHTGACVATENIPLNIGLIASYLNKLYGKSIEIHLFKYPEKLLSSLKTNEPHILGVSNYAWNSNLAEWACKKAKMINPNILTIQGGWNFPLDKEERFNFLNSRKSIDLYVIHEGEIAFANIIEKYLHLGPQKLLDIPLSGCTYIDKKHNSKELITGETLPRIKDLDLIPSPYTTGLLDEFFDGILMPIIETTRGCPFTCTYCNSANSYYSKIRRFSDDYVLSELQYISKKIKGKDVGSLFITDTNFGMYTRDIKIAKYLAKSREEISWPQNIFITTGKNKIDRVFKAVDCLKDLSVPSLSMQSMNPETQKEIKRSNLKLLPYNSIVKNAEAKNLLPMAELIVPLPKETLDTYWEGIEKLINIGNIRIISYTLQLNYGTVFRQKDFLIEHGYKSKYRLVPNDFGIYDNEFVFEPELVAISSKYLSFEDYLKIRCFTFYLETMYCSLFEEFLKFVLEIGLTRFMYAASLRDQFDTAPQSLIKTRDSFINDTKNELFSSEKELSSFYSNPDNYSKLKEGIIGSNVLYKHSSLAMSEHHEDLINYIAHCTCQLAAKQDKSANKTILNMVTSIKNYCKAKLQGIFDPRATESEVSYKGEYDIKEWLDNKSGKKLNNFMKTTENTFIFNDKQKRFRNDSFARCGTSIQGKAKILARTEVLKKLARVHKNP